MPLSPSGRRWRATSTDAPDYPAAAIREMHRQVGDLLLDERGIAERGLPRDISRNTYVNVMAQYRPCGLAHRHPAIARGITATEYREAVEAALEEGIHRLDERHTLHRLFPAWDF